MSLPGNELKRRAIAHTYLLSALRYLDRSDVYRFPTSPVPLAEVEEKLTEKTLLDGLHQLRALGKNENPRAAFWKHLSSAAEAIDQADLTKELHALFLLTLKMQPKINGEN